MALHIIQTPLSNKDLAHTLSLVIALDVVLLIESATTLAQENSTTISAFSSYKTYCLQTHAEALGVAVDSSITSCSMDTFVELTETHQQSISW